MIVTNCKQATFQYSSAYGSNTLETIRHLKFELLEHLHYSWYSTPSDFHMLRNLRKDISVAEEQKNGALSRLCGCSLITKLVERFSLVQPAEEGGRAAAELVCSCV
jgi:hypothetical protein